MKLLFSFLLTILLSYKVFAAELIFNCHGTDKFPVFDQIDDKNTFMTYTAEYIYVLQILP